MKCEQARSMMTAYRELRDGKFDTTELDVHLEECASCRQALARNMFIGDKVRALPTIEPAVDMHAKLMHALAHEQMQFLKKAVPGTVTTPEFLKPYLRDQARSTKSPDALSKFSTAETGPLPILHTRRKSRSRSHMSQFAVLGLAAMFLMVLMMGGLISLLLVARGSAPHLAHISNTTSNSLDHIDIQQGTYPAVTSYQHVASAVANRDSIFYTAYQEGTPAAWMLFQLDRTTRASTPLLEEPGDQPIIVLGSNAQWVVWLQYDDPIAQSYKHTSTNGENENQILQPWSIRVLSLTQLAQANDFLTPTVLLTGTFNEQTVQNWVHTPVQGIWLTQSVLLVAMIDASGTSHLQKYQLNLTGKSSMSEIATASPGHLLSSPTSNSNATQIYWADEWLSDAGVLNSNIWMQQEINAPGAVPPSHGRWAGYIPQITTQEIFTTDDMSFHPQIADDTLFWLSTASSGNSQGTPATNNSSVVTEPQISTSLISRTDASVFSPSLDAEVQGQVLMQPLNSDTPTQPVPLSGAEPAYGLQVGTDFVLWQGNKGYEMFDVPTQNDVVTGNVLNSASFLAVNGDSAVWTVAAPASTTGNTSGTLPMTNLFAFNWPK